MTVKELRGNRREESEGDVRMSVTCRCGKRRYLVWSRNRSILPPWPVSSISIFTPNTLSTFRSTSRSASLSQLFQHRPAVAFTWLLHRIMHSVAFPFVSTSIVPRLPFLFSTRFPFFHLFDARFVRHLPQCAHFFDASSLKPFPIFSACTSYFQTESLFFYFNIERRRIAAHFELRWPGYDLIVRYYTIL